MPHTVYEEEGRAGFRLAFFVEEVFGVPVKGVVRSCGPDFVTIEVDGRVTYRRSYATVFFYPAVPEQEKWQFRFTPPKRRNRGRRC